MLQALQFIATFAASLFAGAALYINVAEHPARMVLETKVAALHWAPSYERATRLQAPLALLSLVAGTAAWLMGGNLWWFVAALLIGAVVPFTFVVVMPTNHRLLSPGRDLASVETRRLLQKWGKLHAVRTLLSLAASIIYLWLLREANDRGVQFRN
jgi:anthrone oxygenase-like protein